MQTFNFGEDGDQLSFNRYQGADCDGGAPTLVDDDIIVRSRWGFTRAFYRDYLDDINMCDFGGSISLNDADGMELGCCNVVLIHGDECESDEADDDSNRRLAAQDKLSFGQN